MVLQAVQPHKMARGSNFFIYELEGLYYLCSENKGADQLRGYHEADLRLVFAYATIRFSHDAANFVRVQADCRYSDLFEIEIQRPTRRLHLPTCRCSIILVSKKN